VSCDGEEPGFERGVLEELASPLPSVGKGFLDEVIDVAGVEVGAAEDEAEESRGDVAERPPEVVVHGMQHPG